MILGAVASDTIEDVAAAAPINCNRLLEVVILRNRSATYDLVRRAELTGYRGIVVEVRFGVLISGTRGSLTYDLIPCRTDRLASPWDPYLQHSWQLADP